VSVSGVPSIPVTVGKVVRNATFVAEKSSPRALVFEYRIQAGDNDADGISVKNTFSLPSGSSAVDAAGNALVLSFTSPVTKRVLIDTLPPAVTSIKPPTAKIYRGGDAMELTVTFSEPVQVSGTPAIPLAIGDQSRVASFAGYATGSANRTLRFRAVASPGDLDTDGVSYSTSIVMSSSTISDGAGNAASVVLPLVLFAKVLVDAVPPTVLAVSPPVFDTVGSTLTVRVTFSERVVVTGKPTIPFALGSANRSLTYVSGTGTSVLVFRYSVSKNTDDVSLPVKLGSAVSVVGASIRDVAGNAIASASLPRSS
jgi:hypothetical protein